MKTTRLIRRLSVVAVLIATLAGITLRANAGSQSEGRDVRFTLLPDFSRGSVEVDGRVLPGDISPEAAGLADWGLGDSLQVWKAGDQESGPWNVQGSLNSGEIVSDSEGAPYHLSLGPFHLAPGDSLALVIPFANVHFQEITPPPENLGQFEGSTAPLFPDLQYSAGDAGRELLVDIPFTPIRKEIYLTLTPLIGEALAGQSASFRLSGEVVFEGMSDYVEFERHCEANPDSRFFRYRVADLLFALDYPPAYNFGFLNPAYQFKPTYSMLRSDVSSCQYEADGGWVKAHFTGRVFSVERYRELFPQPLKMRDLVEESHRKRIGPRGPTGEYELRLGEIILAPGDVLRITLPDTDIRYVTPPPARFVYDSSGQTQVEYQGPQRFALSVGYAPRFQLLLRQFPATLRALAKPIEAGFGPLLGRESPRGPWTWNFLVAGLVLGIVAHRLSDRPQAWWGFIAWFLVAFALLYALRGSFGWLLLAAAWYFVNSFSDLRAMGKGLIAMVLVLLALFVDTQAEKLFTVLSTLELEMTPLTPLILAVLSVLIYWLVLGRKGRGRQLTPGNALPFVFFLFTLCVYDVVQKSLPAMALIAGGGAYISYRFHQMTSNLQRASDPALSLRFKVARQSWLVPLGIVAMTALAAQNDLHNTAAVFGPALGIWGPILIPVLLFLSVLLALSAIALLFILLYPVLPFGPGYLKAALFGAYLLALFVLGVGSDDRLITSLDSLLIGRLVYYLSVPMLIGLYFEINQFMREENARRQASKEPAEKLTIEKATGLYLKRVQGLAGTLSGVLSLVAPPIYALLFNQPLVTTYFDLLEKLINLSVAGL